MSASLPFDRVADSYDQTRGGEERGRRFAHELARFLDPSQPVLEIGVGTGVIALGLTELGFRVAGLDLSLPMLRAARSRIGSLVAAGDAHRLPIGDASWDQAYSVWLLHVAGDPAGVLAEVGRILRPGGVYLLIPAMWERAGDPIGEIDWTMHRGLDPSGLRSLSEERLRALARPAGLRPVQAVTWTHRFEESPAEAIRKIETRAYSFLWEITDERWDRFVGPVIEALRALPDPEAPITRISNNRLVVLEKAPDSGKDRSHGRAEDVSG